MGSWSSVLWKLKQETCMSVPWLVFLLSYSIAIWLSFTHFYQPLINFWGQWGGNSNSCARRSLRCCPKANQNPSDTAVNCHFSHKFGNSIWYGGLLSHRAERILAMIQLLLLITVIIGLLSSPFSCGRWSCSSDSFDLLLSESQFTWEIPNKAHKASQELLL